MGHKERNFTGMIFC